MGTFRDSIGIRLFELSFSHPWEVSCNDGGSASNMPPDSYLNMSCKFGSTSYAWIFLHLQSTLSVGLHH